MSSQQNVQWNVLGVVYSYSHALLAILINPRRPRVTVVFWEICLCMCVCIFGQAESTQCSKLFNTNYDMLEKIIIQSFAGKASVKRKGLQTLQPSHRAVSACGLMRCTICVKP